MPTSERHIVIEASEEEFEALVAKPSVYAVMRLIPTDMLIYPCTLVVRSAMGRTLECYWRPAFTPPGSESVRRLCESGRSPAR
jgi:hypothetical protein